MSQDLDRIADIVASRIRAQLGRALPALGESCVDACTECGHCPIKLEGDVRALTREHGAARIATKPGIEPVSNDLAQYIDHTLLKPETTAEEIDELCVEAKKYSFASVCVNSSHVSRAKSHLAGSPVMVCAVVGFPLGAMLPNAKAFETREAVRAGADEIDMVINIGALKAGDYALVQDDIAKVVNAARPAKVKVILETGMLDEDEKIAGCTLSKLAGAAFVKTSTGFGKGGATAGDVALMRRVVGKGMGVKASGGVRSAEDVRKMVAAGANRIGASASVAIVTGGTGTSQY